MISTSKKFLFIHVPKTGGNSIQNIIREYSSDQIVCVDPCQDGSERFELRNANYPLTKHSSLREYADVIEPELFSRLFKFATVRNPWEMLISFYFSPNRGVCEWNRGAFKKLIKKTKVLRDYISVSRVASSGRSFFFGPKKTAAGGLTDDIDFLIRFERLNADFAEVCKKLGLPMRPLPKRNQSVHLHYSRYYDEELISLVARKFHEEIAWGGYRFEAKS